MAVSLVAILALGGLLGAASAQTPLDQAPAANLIIEKIEYGNPRIAGVPAPINITVRNIGNLDWSGTQAWSIFVGINGETQDACIERDNDNIVSPLSNDPCYIKFIPGQSQRGVPRNEAITVSMSAPWNATHDLAPLSNTIFAEILPYPAQPTQEGATCQGPESRNDLCRDNQYRERRVEVKRLGVRVTPVRAPSAPDADLNQPWRAVDIRASDICPIAPANLTRGCHAVPGQSYIAIYTMQNVGNVSDTFSPQLDATNEFRARNYIIDFAPRNVTLQPNEVQEVRVRITIPENDTADRRTNVDLATEKIRWRSIRAPYLGTDSRDQTPGCSDAAFRPYCVNPTLPSFITDHRYAFNLTSNFSYVNDLPQGATATFLLNVTNNGNSPDRYNVSLDNTSRTMDERWSFSVIAPPDPVEPGQMATYRLLAKAPERVANTSYHIGVSVRSIGDEARALTAPCKSNEVRAIGTCGLQLTTHVAQAFRLQGIEDGSARIVPNEPVVYNLGIHNDGNGYDNVTLELGQSVGGWDARLSNRTIALTPFHTTTFTLTVVSPPNTLPNTDASFFVNATSTGPRDTPSEQRSKVSIQSRMTVISGPNLRIEAPLNSSFVDAGATVDFDVTLRNVGNVVDSFTVPLPERPADWGVTVSPEGPFELQPNQEATVRVSLTAPQSAEVGERATALVKVGSTVDRLLQKQITLEGRVSGPDYFIDNVLVDSASPYSGDKLAVTVALGNAGNRPADANATLRLYFVQNGVERIIGEKVFPAFSIGGQRRLSETFVWDTTGVEGAGVILARIDVGDLVKEIDESEASNEKSRAITLRTFDIQLRPAAGLSARPGERITYGEEPNVFTLEYRGNQPSEPVTVRFESENGWLSSSAEFPQVLLRNTPLPVIATLDVPTLPGVGSDKLTITVIPSLRPTERLVATVVTTLVDEEKPIVRAIRATPTVATLGTPVKISVDVEDATGLSSVTAYVTGPTNETTSLTLFREGGTTWSANRTFTVAGPFRVTAEAIDAASPPNRNTTRDLVGTFTMNPGSAPTIKLAQGQMTTIRTGSAIKLDVRDPLGVGKATYSIKGVSYDLQAPAYQIDTSTFQAGTLEVNVTAENIYGVATTERFTFTVDNALPGITRVTLNPERPRANEDVTITIQTETKVEAVDVLVKRDGQVLQTLNASRRIAGTFVATFTPPEGEYSLDVTARDAAGNTRIEQGAVVFSAKTGAVPGPMPWMALLALAALALLMRRR